MRKDFSMIVYRPKILILVDQRISLKHLRTEGNFCMYLSGTSFRLSDNRVLMSIIV